MTATTLFGIALSPLYAAIAQVESDNGKTSPNVYQLTRVYVSDCNRICGGTFNEQDRTWHGGKYDFQDFDRYRARWIAEKMMLVYWEYYCREAEKDGLAINAELLANMHRYGYQGAKRYQLMGEVSPYWTRVNAHYQKEIAK